MHTRHHLNIMVMLLLLLAGAHARAASVTYYLNHTNADPLLPDGTTNYLSVMITDGVSFGGDSGAVRFDVSLLEPLQAIASTGLFGIDRFFFNTNQANPPDSVIGGLPAGWRANAAPPRNTAGGFGAFDIAVTTSNKPGDSTLTFYVTGVSGDSVATYHALSSGDASEGNAYFAAHVRGFADLDPTTCSGGCVTTSAWFGDGDVFDPQVSTVPVPAAAWLLGSALIALGTLGSRQRNIEVVA